MDKSRAQIPPGASADSVLSLLGLQHGATILENNIYFSEISVRDFTIWLTSHICCYLPPKGFFKNVYLINTQISNFTHGCENLEAIKMSISKSMD